MNKKNIPCNTLFNFVVYTAIIAGVLAPQNGAEQYSAAYLDPGTGTMILSAIVGIFATLALAIKTFWYKIAKIFKAKKDKKD